MQGEEVSVNLGPRYYFMPCTVSHRLQSFCIHPLARPATLHGDLAQGSLSQNPGLNGGTGTN